MNAWRRWLDALLPPAGQNAAVTDCLTWRPDPPTDYCPRCGATTPRAAVTERGCPHCVDRRLPWDQVWRLSAYHPPISHWIVQLKFHRQWHWADFLASHLAAALPAASAAHTLITPVPMHWRRRLRRGYNGPDLIARRIARLKHLPCVPLLRRIRLSPPQSRLKSAVARRANIRASFAPRRIDLSGQTIFLIDDVKTTGITAGHCARLLRRMGAAHVHLALVAVADPH